METEYGIVTKDNASFLSHEREAEKSEFLKILSQISFEEAEEGGLIVSGLCIFGQDKFRHKKVDVLLCSSKLKMKVYRWGKLEDCEQETLERWTEGVPFRQGEVVRVMREYEARTLFQSKGIHYVY